MAKEKTESKETTKVSRKSSEPEGWIRESIRVDENVWAEIKISAMKTKQTISQILHTLMSDYVKKQK